MGLKQFGLKVEGHSYQFHPLRRYIQNTVRTDYEQAHYDWL